MANQLFNINTALEAATERLGNASKLRKLRSDAGTSRTSLEVSGFLKSRLSGDERPGIKKLQEELSDFCLAKNLTVPSRVTVYRFIDNMAAPKYEIGALPHAVREALYNLGDTGAVPGDQLAFYCFNYGGSTAVSFASGLPWICLHLAFKMKGHRPGARGLLEAVMKTRGI